MEIGPLPVLGATGHRYFNDDPIAERAKAKALHFVRSAYERFGTRKLKPGMAYGWDFWVAQAAIALRNNGVCPLLEVDCYVPFHTQYGKWPPPLREEWELILQDANRIFIQEPDHPGNFWQITYLQLLADLGQIEDVWRQEQYDRGIPHQKHTQFPSVPNATELLDLRNHALVDGSDGMLGCWEYKASGTAKCIGYALGKARVQAWNPKTNRLWKIPKELPVVATLKDAGATLVTTGDKRRWHHCGKPAFVFKKDVPGTNLQVGAMLCPVCQAVALAGNTEATSTFAALNYWAGGR